ncbi:MAG: endonuclease/exonuclease/phosphatase family protein [Phycisphaerales bacterium]
MLKALRILLAIAALALCVCSVLPEIQTGAWWVRGFDFPRAQAAAFIVLVLLGQGVVGWLAHRQRKKNASAPQRASVFKRAIIPALLVGALAWQCFRILPYTPVFPVQMEAARGEPGETLCLLVYNVRYDNTKIDALLETVRKADPDVVLLAEPTRWWHDRLAPLAEAYPHAILQPQDNHYGMLLYSRHPLIAPEVRFLVEDGVPSMLTTLQLPSGREVRLYGVHPKPPGLKRPIDSEREDSHQRDAELLMIAREVKDARDAGDATPVIVAGDFNDVAWSHTTRLFQRVSGLLDPRVGRGFYNSFHARRRIYRFPIDHVFASDHFRLVSLQVLPDIGSDHHPVLATLALEPTAPLTQDEPDPQGDDLEEAEETIREGKEEVREDELVEERTPSSEPRG